MIPKLLKHAPSTRYFSNSKLAQVFSTLTDLVPHLTFHSLASLLPVHLFSEAKLYK